MTNSKIIADSCCDLDKKLKKEYDIQLVPLSINIESKSYIDKDLDCKDLLNDMKASKVSPKTACPSPEDYYKSFEGEEKNIYVVTLSKELSGSYNSAVLAKKMYEEECIEGKNIHIFNSKNASVGETLISIKIRELIKNNLRFENIIEKTSEYIDELKTFFLLDSMQNLVKAGRINAVTAKITEVLNIKLVCGSTKEGAIRMIHKSRGEKNALAKLIEVIGEEGKNLEEKILGIAYCNCLEKAIKLKEKICEKYKFKDIVMVETGGISTTYADDGGLVIAF